jgi:hypothetical protein
MRGIVFPVGCWPKGSKSSGKVVTLKPLDRLAIICNICIFVSIGYVPSTLRSYITVLTRFTVRMEEVRSSETFVNSYKSSRRHNPQDHSRKMQ